MKAAASVSFRANAIKAFARFRSAGCDVQCCRDIQHKEIGCNLPEFPLNNGVTKHPS